MQCDPPLPELLDRAVGLLTTRRRAILGVAGLPGAGKTTLAETLVAGLAARLGAEVVAHIPMDGFHLADVQLERLGLRQVKGAPDTFDAWGYAATLARVREAGPSPVYAPGFERTLEQPIAAAVAVPPDARLVVTEGNYLLLPDPPWASVRAAVDEIWQVEVDDDLRVERLIARHVEFGKAPAAAEEWVRRSDEANARLIRTAGLPPDLVVRLAPARS